MKDSRRSQADWFPEVGTIEFYTRINTLLEPSMKVLDFGAGRGEALTDSGCGYKKRLMMLRGKVAEVIACDVGEAVLDNPGVDSAVVIQLDVPLPFADSTFDLIVSDFVFEHIADPVLVSAEL